MISLKNKVYKIGKRKNIITNELENVYSIAIFNHQNKIGFILLTEEPRAKDIVILDKWYLLPEISLLDDSQNWKENEIADIDASIVNSFLYHPSSITILKQFISLLLNR